MGFGLFGKLPQKRDFVSHGLASGVLLPWETWLQSAIGASRAELQGDWERYFLVAPLWRFWIGPGIFGQCVAGVLMASVDQVGRYFPLTLSYAAEGESVVTPPTLGDVEAWFQALDQRLLSVLAEEATMEPASLILDLPEPPQTATGAPDAPIHLLPPGAADGTMPQAEHSLRERDYVHAMLGRSYWWMNATAAAAPQLIGFNGLADPGFFSRMLLYPAGGGAPA
ncbi:type VI secretion system-associated protein TagF [Nostoc sp. 3335mG]|nr:type VI secretion system-associated protein TagF [Nostoc sp. 3335mG]